MILFLDFDGVLHPEPSKAEHAFCRLYTIEQMLNDFPRVEIVVSSAWRLDWETEAESVAGLREHFSMVMRGRVVGVTPDLRATDPQTAPDGLGAFVREWECMTWLQANRPPGTPYLMLDDRDWWFRPNNPRLMIVDCDVGFLPDNEEEFRAHLLRMEREANEGKLQ